MQPPSVILILGLSGSGRRTLCDRLFRELDVPYINMRSLIDGHQLTDE